MRMSNEDYAGRGVGTLERKEEGDDYDDDDDDEKEGD